MEEAPQQYPPRSERRLVTLFVMAGAIMNQIDTTIANVALPHMQGTTSASREQITWVLTSYLVALAIGTPLAGWLATRYGRKKILLGSIFGFTVASLLCGMAASLDQLIAFRILQGFTGSALVPLSQATMIDTNPPEDRGRSMAMFSVATILGPLAGPVLGGWLTENFSWHWVFLINLPIGIFAFVGLSAVMREGRIDASRRFDMTGFGLLAIAIGAMQLMLDRGQQLDWFQSLEICIEAVIAGACLYMFVVHILTFDQPFIHLAIFRDRNFVLACGIWLALSVMIFSILSLIPPMLADEMGYPIMLVGLVTAPRGLGSVIAILAIGRFYNRIDPRIMAMTGISCCALSSLLLSRMSLQADATLILLSGVVNGMGSSMISVPMSTIAFVTMNPRYSNEAAAMSALTRYIGSSTGIALLQALTTRNEAAVHSRLVESIRPDSPVMSWAMPDFDPTLPESVGRLVHEVARQSLMVSYIDSYWALSIVGLIAAPCVWFLKAPKRTAS